MDRRFTAFLEATRGLPEDSPAFTDAAHRLALEDAGIDGYLRSSRGDDGLFGSLDGAFGIDSIVFLLPVDGEEPTRIHAAELLSKVAFLDHVAMRLAVGVELPIFDELLELLVDSNQTWAQSEARWLASRRRRVLEFVARAISGTRARAPAICDSGNRGGSHCRCVWSPERGGRRGGVRSQRRASPSARVFAVAAATECAAWIAVPFGSHDFVGVVLFVLVVAVVATPVLESAASPTVSIAVVGYALSRLAVRYRGIHVMALSELLAGLVLVAYVFGSTTREESTWVRRVRRVEGLAFAEGLALVAFLGALDPEMHLHDTYFAVSGMHFEGLVLVFALLRSARRAGGSRLGWLGLALAALGAQVFGLAMAVLGKRGMPRRYVHYLPQFTSQHRIISVGAFVLLVGFALVLAAQLGTTRARDEN